MQLDRLVHVYRMPLDFSDAKECCLFLCDCPRMDCAWNLLDHMDTSAMSSVDTLAKLDFCIHSTAIRALHDTGFIPYSSMASREVCSRLTDFDFSCDKQPVCLIQSSPSLLLSCDFGNGQPCEGRSRVFIRTNQQRRYVCGSCCGTAGLLTEPCCHCIPVVQIGSQCQSGSDWCSEDPVTQGWIKQKDARLSSMAVTVLVDVYYR